jgi:hypothetical protein
LFAGVPVVVEVLERGILLVVSAGVQEAGVSLVVGEPAVPEGLPELAQGLYDILSGRQGEVLLLEAFVYLAQEVLLLVVVAAEAAGVRGVHFV